MCRRLITHYMHHDVQVPMILDSISPGAPVYANPSRTQFHRCELDLQPMDLSAHIFFPYSKPMGKCEYHTCCVPYMYVEYCADFVEENMEYHTEPEECGAFILEHQHERLPCLGDEYSNQGEIPTTWRQLRRIRGINESKWLPEFAHEPHFRPNWEDKFFAECEKLYTLEKDTSIMYAAMLDLIQSNPPCPWSTEQAAKGHVLKAEGELYKQRQLVFDLFKWGTEPCGSCQRTEESDG
ncbi:hypothetical protein F5B22DRAFT_653870 [Xylaria bambusicola]|uniref:uncharacterized protein n=1 Tax=Xylaria bambusicola TaxID=326684 RepID=UPI0020080F44|nr:uncharacterized protein F5B22DRAFT_653870 [Xylaria bambusicola]KAI0502767.1 hypothetical protein F5B22DRAFT_653870 [Xylaria bambusicola]